MGHLQTILLMIISYSNNAQNAFFNCCLQGHLVRITVLYQLESWRLVRILACIYINIHNYVIL